MQRLLTGLPCHTLPRVETLWLDSEALQPLPICLPGLVRKMKRLRVLRLYRATAATLADTLEALATAPVYTLETLDLYNSFSLPAMHALCAALLGHSKSVTGLWLAGCGLTDDLACILATPLHRLPELRIVHLYGNSIRERGGAALDECKTTNKRLYIRY